MKKEVIIGLTYGDPASVGPEILSKTLVSRNFKFKTLIVGKDDYLSFTAKNKFKKNNFIYPNIKTLNLNSKNKVLPGKPSLDSAVHAYECLKYSVSLLLQNKLHALITGPVSKEIIQLYKANFLGQTDEIARLCKINPNNVIMSFVSNDLRIALYSRHVPLLKVPALLIRGRLKNFIILLNEQIKKWFLIKNPKIAILGLNPHAGENGTFGIEEIKIIAPVIKKLRSAGIDVYGPFSSDALLAEAGKNYLSNKKQKYDFYISMYHDQCLPMFKAVAGFKGVNLTLGLPFLRLSPDHGTAFDIAGLNKASNESLISCLKLLEKLLATSD